jgi:hydrogenase 3 maturation protease
MLSPKRKLKNSLKGAKRIAVLGIGSPLRGDDALGLALIEKLKKSLKKTKSRIPVKLFSCGVIPESYTGEIKKFKPSLILIIDALDLGKVAGEISIIDTKSQSANVSFSTHGLPLKMLIDYLSQSLGCKIVPLGIQPKSIIFGSPISAKVAKAVKDISSLIIENIAQ